MTQKRHRGLIAKSVWAVVKWGMFLAVLIFVGRHGYKLWTEVDSHPTRLSWGWLALATATSVAAWLPSVWYWRKLILNLGMRPPWPQVFRSYYCGHLGKYLPGKAAAIVIRAALIRDAGVPAAAAALTVTVESLTYMCAGTLLAILLFSWLAPYLPAWIAAGAAHPLRRGILIFLILCGGVAGLAVVVRSYDRLLAMFRGAAAESLPPRAVAPVRTSLAGVVVFLAAWWIQGLTLGLTIQAASPEPVNWGDWPFWTGTAAVALVGGFVAVFTPGGLGVREGLLMELLSRQLGPHEAVLVAVLMRGVALAGEILIAGALYYGVAGVNRSEESQR
ncbi:MAG: lysylphosphatidylglycerol synthase transmembrane domain-containing protein [Deltaproteobacteria bacterium]